MTETTLYLLKAMFLGIIEGLTEFIPVSSTGHLILVGDWINFQSSSGKVFEVVIQFGSILAVMWIFRLRLWQLIRGTLTGVRSEMLFTRNLLLAFVPAAVIGAMFIHAIKSLFYHPGVVGVTLVLGGLVMLYVERRTHTAKPGPGATDTAARDSASEVHASAHRLEEISWKQALGVGCAQCLAMVPGVSRSGSTIIGGMIAGMQRKTATEFSFFLAMPTMLGATVYDSYKNMHILSQHDVTGIIVGFVAAFLSALVVVRAVLRFVANHTYRVFAWYRIALGILVGAVLFAPGCAPAAVGGRGRQPSPMPSVFRHGEVEELQSVAVDDQPAATRRLGMVAIPIGQYPAFAPAAVDLQHVALRPVRVAVHQRRHARLAEQRLDGIAVDVHDLGGLGLVGGHALAARLLRQGQSFRDGAAEEISLPCRVAHHRAELLVGLVVRAQLIAVRQQDIAVVGCQQGRLRQQARADGGGQLLAHQEVAVAASEPHGHGRGCIAQALQGRGQPGRRLADDIVADPGVEDIARQQQRRRFRGGRIQKAQERFRRGRRGRPQVDVRGNPDAAGQRHLTQGLRPFR